MIRKLAALTLAALTLVAFPAFADPDGIRVGTQVIVSPIEKLGNLEDINLSYAHARGKTQSSSNAPDIWLAADPSQRGGGVWRSAGLMKIGIKKSDGDFVALRLWSRRGGKVWVKDLPASAGDIASYKVNVGHDSFVITSKADGSLHVDGTPVGRIG